MNIKAIAKIVGKIMVLEGILMCAPLIVAFIYKEYQFNLFTIWGFQVSKNILAFALPIIFLVVIGLLLQLIKPKRKNLYQREAFVLCALVWIVMALFGCVPFMINGDIPYFFNAFFETMSGFTTTGASVVNDVALLLHSSLFWRSFTHWIGGMGILVFILIFIPESDDGSALHLLRAESPGPQVGKLASKMKATTTILYLIYLGLTVIGTILLLIGPAHVVNGVTYKMGLFEALLTIFGSAGTGGFGFLSTSMEYFSAYHQYVIAILLLLFGTNFSLYFLILVGKVKEVFKSEEFKTYIIIIAVAVVVVMGNLLIRFDNIRSLSALTPELLELRFRQSFFQVASIITTTGFSSTNYQLWPALSKVVIILLMLCGAMAGSTGGGIKVSRLIIAVKGVRLKIKKIINPRYVESATFEDKPLEDETINDVFTFLTIYALILFSVVLVLSLDHFNHIMDPGYSPFLTNFTATISCLSNIGPGLDSVGPYANYNNYSSLSKFILTITMLIGRLEIYPVIILLSPRTYRKA